MDANITTALPKLPGFSFPELHERSTLNKTQTLIFRSGISFFVPLDTLGVRPEKARISIETIRVAHPAWSTTADKVLRFFGYFVERNGDASWVRPVNIMYFLDNGTVLVTEPQSVNQRFLKRQVLEGVNPETLSVGAVLNVNGRKFTLIDCDDFTRSVYTKLDYPQAPAIPLPKDDTVIKVPPQAIRAVQGQGKKLASAVNRSLIENDKKVLRFPAYWVEKRSDARNFDFLYYIADGTISIQEVIPPNSGRDPSSNFYKRSRLPKGCDRTAVTKGLDTIAPKTVSQYHTHEDLSIGAKIRVYGREFVLYDADQYTRDFYAKELGTELGPTLPFPTSQADATAMAMSMNASMQVTLPPHNGIGSEEDSMGSLRYLVLKAPKKDLKKIFEHGKDILRFRATLHNARPEDSVRNFVVCYYVGDDTVSVYEQSGVNTGFSAGRFLGRQRVRTSGPTEAATYLTADDFQVGSTISIYQQVFQLHQMDERTAVFLDNQMSTEQTKAEDVLALVAKLRSIVTMKYSRYTDAFRAYNISKGRGLSVDELKRMFADASIAADDDATLAVMRYLDTDSDGFVGFGEFVQYMTASDDPSRVSSVSTNTTASYRKAVLDVKQKQFAQQTFKMFRDKLSSRRLVLVDAFRIMSDRSTDSLVGMSEFKQVVNDYLQMNFTEDQMAALCTRFFVSAVDPNVLDEKRRLNLREFQRLIDQDHYAL